MTDQVIPDEAIEAAAEALVGSTLGDRRGINWEEFFEAARLALNAAAPYMQPDLLEEWAIQFAGTFIEEADSKADAHRRLHEIREAIVDGIESPALEPMHVVCRYRVASSELTKWKVATP